MGAYAPALDRQRAEQLQNDRWQRQEDATRVQIAPLSQQLQADRLRLASYVDPKTLQPLQGHEQDYETTLNRMADTIGKMRGLMGDKAPQEDPGRLKSAAASLLDKLHVTRDLQHHLAMGQSNKANQYAQQNRDMAQAEGAGVVPYELTPEGKAAQSRHELTMEEIDERNKKPPTETSDVRARRDYDDFLQKNPDYKGTFEQWKTEQAAVGRNAVPKPKTFDQKYQDVLLKKAQGQPLSTDDKALESAWDLWNKKKYIDPQVARAAAFGANRYIPVVDPQNPENVVMMRAGDAARMGANTPASIGFQTDKSVTRYMTSGQGGANINYFNTANDHLKLLKQAADALQNGNTQLFNRLANAYATATGDAAPTNFETVKAAVAGELSKTFKGTGATDQEISTINQTINNAMSPDQINGAIGYYTNLMDSKLSALEEQYAAAKEGRPAFPTTNRTKQLQGMRNRPTNAYGTVEYQGKKYWVDRQGNNLGEAK
jgi:hypothetical protein